MAKNLNKTGSATISAATEATVAQLDMGTVKLSITSAELVADSKSYGTGAVAIDSDNLVARTALGLNLVTYSSGWVHKYLPTGQTNNANAITGSYTGEDGLVDWKCFKFVISYDLSDVVVTEGMDKDAQFDLQHPNAESLDISVAKTTGDTLAANCGVFAITTTAPTAAWDSTNPNATSLSAASLGASHDATLTIYVYVYCDGVAHAYDNATPNANFTVTIGAH